MLEQRSLSLLKTIISNQLVTISDLVLATSLTRRQISYDLIKIDNWLVDNNFSKVVSSERGELYIEEKELNEILDVLLRENNRKIFSEEERHIIIYLYIFIYENENYISLNHLIDLLDVSRGTIINDIKNVSKSLQRKLLSISYSRSKGYYIRGQESLIVNEMIDIVNCLVSLGQYGKIFHTIVSKKDKILLDEITMIADIEFNNSKIFCSDNCFLKIVSIFFCVIIRKKNLGIEFSEEIIKLIRLQDEFDISKRIVQKVFKTESNNTNFSDFLASLILAYTVGDSLISKKDPILLKFITENILLRLETSYGISFKNLETAKVQIYSRFRPTFYCSLFGYPVNNSMLSKAKIKYEGLFNILVNILKGLNLQKQLVISDDAIAYLTILMVPFIKNEKNEKPYTHTVTAAVICPSGIGISLILLEELKELFPDIKFLEPLSFSQLEKFSENIDIIFSTELIITSKPLYIVSPMMTGLEKDKLLKNFYNSTTAASKIKKNNYAEDLLHIIDKHTEIKNLSALIKDINNFTSNHILINSERRSPMLSEIMSENLIQLNIEAQDWKDCIRKSGAPLVKYNKVKEEYIQAMIESAESFGPYIVITKNVALPHARPEEGVKELAISLTILKKPIEFGNKENDPVKYVFCLSAINNSTHLRAISSLVELLENKEFYYVLDNAKTEKEIYDFIKKNEKG